MLKSRNFALLIVASLIFIGLLWVWPISIGLNPHKAVIEKKVKDSLNLTITIGGNVRLVLFPSIKIEIHNVQGSYNNLPFFNIQQLQVPLSLKNLFTLSSLKNINNIIAKDGTIVMPTYISYIKNLRSADKITGQYRTNSQEIRFENILIDSDEKNSHIKIKTLHMEYSADTKLLLKSEFLYRNALNILSFTIYSNSSNASLNLQGSGITVNIVGQNVVNILSPEWTREGALNGNLTAKITDLNALLLYLPLKITNNAHIFQTQTINQPIDIMADLNLQKGTLSLTNFRLSEQNVISNLRGGVFLDLKHQGNLNTFLAIDELKIDSLLLDSIVTDPSSKKELFPKIYQLFSFSSDETDPTFSPLLLSVLDINIGKIRLLNDNISNVRLSMDSYKELTSLLKLSFTLPENTDCTLQGEFSHNNIRPKFEGKVNIQSKTALKSFGLLGLQNIENILKNTNSGQDISFSFNANIIAMPKRIVFENISSNLQDSKIDGRFIKAEHFDDTSSAYSYLNIDHLNLDMFGAKKRFEEYLLMLYASDFDKTGKLFRENNNDFAPLRYLNTRTHLQLNIGDMKFKDVQYSDCSASAIIQPSEVKLNNFHITSDFLEVSGNLNFALPTIRPLISGDINFKGLNVNNWHSIFPKLIELKLQYINSQTTQQNQKIAESLVQYANFFSASMYDAALNIKSDFTVVDDMILKDAFAKINLHQSVLSIENGLSSIWGGRFQFGGSVITSDFIPTFYTVFSFDSISPSMLLYKITGLNPDKFSGYLSMSGSLHASGNTPYWLCSTLNGDIQLAAKEVKWNGFQLGDIISIIDINALAEQKLARLDYDLKYGSTFFDNLKGKISINQGIATLNDFEMSNNRAVGAYAASYNIFYRTLEALGRFSFYPIQNQQILSLNLQSSGSLPNLNTRFDTNELVAFINDNSAHPMEDKDKSEPSLSQRLLGQ